MDTFSTIQARNRVALDDLATVTRAMARLTHCRSQRQRWPNLNAQGRHLLDHATFAAYVDLRSRGLGAQARLILRAGQGPVADGALDRAAMRAGGAR